jgi:hypothetical protein
VGGKNFSLHAEGERVFLTQEGQQRREVDLVPPAQGATGNVMPAAICPDGSPTEREIDTGEPAPGTSPLDNFLASRGGSDVQVDIPTDPHRDTTTAENGGAP